MVTLVLGASVAGVPKAPEESLGPVLIGPVLPARLWASLSFVDGDGGSLCSVGSEGAVGRVNWHVLGGKAL